MNIIEKAERIHLIGIGGIGMSGLAKLLIEKKKKISGSDKEYTPIIKKLERKGVKIFIGQKEENITPDIQLVIYSHAILPDNPEYRKAVSLKIPLLSYPEALGLFTREKRTIAVSGTHGKTTVSSLIVSILSEAKMSPSFVIGGEIIGKGNSQTGKGEFLVIEACEYKKSFLNYLPEIGVINTIEEDHLDFYKNLKEIKEAFCNFCKNVKRFIVGWEEDRNVMDVIKKSRKENITFGIEKGDVRAEKINFFKNKTTFECIYLGKSLGKVSLKINGYHNILNSLSAISVGLGLDIPWKFIKNGIERFKGVHRRCEIVGKVNGITIIDDYGHHPTEIKCTLSALRNIYPENRIIVVFQPHQYSRTRFLLEDFASSFRDADKVIVPDIYFVRDSLKEKKLVNAEILVDRIRKNGKEALYLPTFKEIIFYLKEIVKKGDVVLTIGAGPVYKVAYGLLKILEK